MVGVVDVRAEVVAHGARSQGLVTRRELLAAGVSEGSLARAVVRGHLVRVRPAVYALEPLAARPRFVVTAQGPAAEFVARARAALLSLGPTALACGRTAAALYGWGMLVEPQTLEVAVDHGRSRVVLAGLHVEQRRRPVRNRLVALPGTDPLWVSSAQQTVVDCALRLPLLEAVVVCDSALRSGRVGPDELERRIGQQGGVSQAGRLADVLALTDGRSESVLESVQRVRMVLGGIEGFEPQVVVRAQPSLRVDFCFRAAGLVVEVDGARWHQDPVRDQARDNALAALGWRVLRYTWAQVVHDPEPVVAEVLAAVASGGPGFRLLAAEDAAVA